MNNKIEFDLYRGKVLSLEDPLQKGRIQVKLLPEMKDIKDSNCPWFEPFEGNCGDNEMSSKNLPEVGSLVWMLADSKFYHKYYLPFKYNIKGKYEFSKVSKLLGYVSNIDKEYKNIQFTLYEDGSLSFHNRSDGSHGFIKDLSSFFIMDSSGNIQINGDSDNAIRYSALEEAYNELNDKFNNLISILTSWVPVPNDGGLVLSTALEVANTPPLSLSSEGDITLSKVDNVLLPTTPTT